MRLWNAFEAGGFSPAWARDHFLHFRALKMARSIYLQLDELLEKLVGPVARVVWHGLCRLLGTDVPTLLGA